MRNVRDSFLHYVADNLPQYEVRNVRRDTNNPGLSDLGENAINICFVGDTLSVVESCLYVSISVVHNEELTAVQMMADVTHLLQSSGTTPVLDYSNPTSPQIVGGNLWWDTKSIKFKPIFSELYTQRGCTMTAHYQNPFGA